MHCPKCADDTRVIETFPDVTQHYRLRVCPTCSYKFLTCEQEVPLSGTLYQLRKAKNANRKTTTRPATG